MRPPPLLALFRRCVQSGISIQLSPDGETFFKSSTGYVSTGLLDELRAQKPATIEVLKGLEAEWQLPPGPLLTPELHTTLALYSVERRHFTAGDVEKYERVLEMERRRGTPAYLAMIWATEAAVIGLNIDAREYRR